MTDILNNRKADNLKARLDEIAQNDLSAEYIINRAFEAGVAAKSDADFAAMQSAMDRARARYEAQKGTEPVAFLDAAPGNLILTARDGN